MKYVRHFCGAFLAMMVIIPLWMIALPNPSGGDLAFTSTILAAAAVCYFAPENTKP